MVGPVRGTRDRIELVWKRRMADRRTAAIGLVISAFGLIGSWWLASRSLLPEYHPELLGVDRLGDTSHPRHTAIIATAVLGLAGAAFAAQLAARETPRAQGARELAGAVVIVAVLLLGVVATVR